MSFSITPSPSILLPQTSILASSSTLSPEDRADRIEQEANDVAKYLPTAKQNEFKAMVRRAVADIRLQIAKMRTQGKTEYEINQVIDGLSLRFDHSKTSYLEGNTQYGNNKLQVSDRNQAIGCSLTQYTPDFSPIARIPVDDENDSQMAATKVGEKNLEFPEVPSIVKQLGKRYVKNKIKNRFGKGPAEVADKLEKFFSTKAPEDDENPWRYRAISVGVQYGITEVLAYCLPTGIPVYAVMNGAHVVAIGADQLTPVLKKMETAEEAMAWWTHTHDFMRDGNAYLESIQMAQGFVELAKVPSICLKTIQNQLIDACSAIADHIHLTDANVAKIAYSTFVFIGKNSPEVLEEQMWAKAVEDLRQTAISQ